MEHFLMAVPQSMHGYFERALTDAQSAGQLRVRHIALVTLQESLSCSN